MKLTDSPALFPHPFARDADPRLVNATLPETTTDSGRVSLLGGFPIANFTALSAGGKPVDGVDMQTLFHMLSIVARAVEAGQVRQWDNGYAQQIGGYPTGAIVSGSTPGTLYVSLVDDNLTNPVTDLQQNARPKSWSTISGSLGGDGSGLFPLPVRYLTGTYDTPDGSFWAREQARLLVTLERQQRQAQISQKEARLKQAAQLAEQKAQAAESQLNDLEKKADKIAAAIQKYTGISL